MKAVKRSADLRENLWRDVGLGVEEVQHVARVLDAVLGRLFWGGEPVVPGAVEVFETTCAVLQLVTLTGNDGLLLGHAAGTEDIHLIKRTSLLLPILSSSFSCFGLTPT